MAEITIQNPKAKIRVGVIGTGSMGKNHARIFGEFPEVHFAAVFDQDAGTAREIAGRYGAKAVSSLEAFADAVDAATIATPTVTHFEIAKALLERGRHVLVEKPFTETPEQARELCDLAQSRGLVLQVGHIERFNPVMPALEKRLTAPRFIEATRLSPYPGRSLDVGVVLDVMIHDLEIILHLVRSPWVSVDAVGVPILSKREDIANVRIRFENGCVANVTASRISQEKVRKIRVFQPDAYLSLDYQKQEGYLLRLAREDEKESTFIGKILGLATDATIVTEFAGKRIVREPVAIERDEPLRRELVSFIECARAGAQPKVSGREATAALELGLEITRQIEAAPRAVKLYLVAGEASGDSRGAELMRALRERIPDAQFLGAGGREMRQLGGDVIFDWADEAVVGLWDVLKKYGYFRRQFHRMLAEIKEAKPAALITIDYPGFNMRLAKAAKARFPGLRTIHYVSPQVWAWHRGRIPKMAGFLDLMLCLFPFELPLYADAGLRAVCVGHPLLDSLAAEKKEQPRDASLVALLPGSRRKEVRKIFPVMLAAAVRLKKQRPQLRFEAAAASESLGEEMNCMISERELGGLPDAGCAVTLRTAHDLMQRAGAGMVCSGTATLESAFFRLPMVILYKVAWLTYAVAKQVVKIPYIGLPNVLAGREIAREFIQDAAQPEPVAEAVLGLLEDSGVREAQQRGQAAVIASLGERGAARRAADAIANALVA